MSDMKISALTYITNPLSGGYSAYLPAIQSFLDVADEAIVVDGGSTDESLNKLANLRGQEKLKIISSELTYWGPGDSWERPQASIQRQVAFRMCEGDWAINFDADHVLPDFEKDSLLKQLDDLEAEGILYAFKNMAVENGEYVISDRVRWWCINKKLAMRKRIKIGYGVREGSGGNERPIVPEREKYFTDPVNKTKKTYYVGPVYPLSGILDITLYKYGHFFFTSSQLRCKLQRWENAYARFDGKSPRTITVDERPYQLINPRSFLSNNRHPKAMYDFLKEFISELPAGDLDIVGLRIYSNGRLQRSSKWVSNLCRRLVRQRQRIRKRKP